MLEDHKKENDINEISILFSLAKAVISIMIQEQRKPRVADQMWHFFPEGGMCLLVCSVSSLPLHMLLYPTVTRLQGGC